MPAQRNRQPRVDLAGLTAWAVPALLIVFLGLSNGGFEPIGRGEVGIVVWWLVLIGTAVNLLPAAGGTLAGRILLAIAVALAAWTALAFTWTESDERTATEVARVSAYVAVFALALGVQGAGRWRQVLHGVTLGVIAICAIAVLSRMEPSWFPEQRAGDYLIGIQIESRLAYPVNYPSGLGALTAIALPLAMGATASARTIAGQALAGAALPVVALALWLTSSGLSVPALGFALLIFIFLAPDRIPKIATLLVGAAGSAILFAAVDQRPELDNGLTTPEALEQGDELLVITLVVCGGVGLIQAGISAWARHARPRWMQVPRRAAAIATGVAAVIAMGIGIAAGGAGAISDEWEDIKSRSAGVDPRGSSRAAEILDFSGSGRYDFWRASVDANATDPLKGTGPGTFDLWWERSGYYEAYVRDGHSLYIETLGELGIVGFALIIGLVAAILVLGAVRAWRAPPELRVGLAAATAGCTAFAAAALVDWVWELGVLAVTFFALAAVAVAGGASPTPDTSSLHHRPPWWRRHAARIAVCIVAVFGIAAIAQPLWGAIELEHSYDDAGVGRYEEALENARDAAEIQPYAATPYMQQALLLEHRGELGAAADAARTATENERTNWLTWNLLRQIEEARGRDQAAAEARRQSVSLGGPRE